MDYRFRVELLKESKDFIDGLDPKTRKKVLYNIWKSRMTTDPKLFKKLNGEIWELRTIYNRKVIRLLAFWDHSEKQDTLVISTHGIIKKTEKTPKAEIEKAEGLRIKYFRSKKGKS
jgi:phage-related protein